MPALSSYDYAVVRVVPRVDREEFINAGVVLFCRTKRFLGSLIELDEARLAVLNPQVDVPILQQHLGFIPLICRGGAAAGPIGSLPMHGRFHWLVSPRATVIQTSPVHSGLCTDPATTLEHLLETLVLW